MITIPIVIDWDDRKEIGKMIVDETLLPNNPDFSFNIGYTLNTETQKYTIVCITPMVYEKDEESDE